MTAERIKTKSGQAYADRMWVVCQAQVGRERHAERVLRDQGFETFVPMVGVWARPAKKRCREAVRRVVFPGYLFADGLTFGSGPVKPVIFGEHIAMVPQPLIDQIHDRLMEGGFDFGQRERTPPTFAPGDRVKVTAGPAAGLHGIVQLASSNGRYVLLQGEDFRRGMLVSVFKVALESREGGHSVKSMLPGGPGGKNQT